MQYMLLIYQEPDAGPPGGEMMPAWAAYGEALRESGAWVAGDALHPASEATTVRVRNDERLLTDGPFAETKEWLGGYYVIDVADLDAALDWAAKIPSVGFGSVEVRPVWDFSGGQD